ncbi:MAG TPA: signal peptidase II [Segeticoccus sp.]|nr:signal peptidase II [Segeticoccus sp.]
MTLVVVAGVVYVLDRLTKLWAVDSLTPGQPRDLVGSVLRLNLINNPGAAFSLATSATWVLTLIAVGVVAAIIYTARRLRSRGWAWALGLLLGGASGNLTDRLVRPPGFGRGHVVDFLQLPHWPIFNIADSAIVSAAVLIVLLALLGIGVDGRSDAGGKHEASDG